MDKYRAMLAFPSFDDSVGGGFALISSDHSITSEVEPAALEIRIKVGLARESTMGQTSPASQKAMGVIIVAGVNGANRCHTGVRL